MTKTILTNKSLFSTLSAPVENILENSIQIPLILTEENQLHYTDTYINLCEQVVDRMFDSNKPARLFLLVEAKHDNVYLYSGDYTYYICAEVPTYDGIIDKHEFEYAYEEFELDDEEMDVINKYLAEHKDNKRFLREKFKEILMIISDLGFKMSEFQKLTADN